jgi:hypothetical protein
MWNLLVKTWQTYREDPPAFESPYVLNQVGLVVERSISSNPIKRRIWRLRGFFYLIPSFILIWIAGIETLARIPNAGFPDWLTPLLEVFLTSLFWQSLALVLILGLLVAINFYRHNDLVDHIQYLTEFTYLQILITMVFVKRINGHDGRIQLEPIKTELQFLNEMLLRGYWSMFASTWPRVKTTLQSEAEDIFRGLSGFDAKRLWGRFIQSSRRKKHEDSARRRLGWFILLAHGARDMLDEFTKKILETHLIPAYRKNTSLEDITNPDLVLDMMLEDPINKSHFEESAMVITSMSGGAFDSLLHTMINMVSSLIKGIELGFDDQKTGSVLRRYLSEVASDSQINNFWNQLGGKGLNEIVERQSNPADRQLIFRLFLEKASDGSIIDSFDHDIWIKALNDSSLLSLLKTRIDKPGELHDMRDKIQEKLSNYRIDIGYDL